MGSGLLVWTLLGCGLIDSARDSVQDVKDKIAGLTNPLVTQSLVLGVEEPEDDLIASMLEASDFEAGTAVSVFLADAGSAGEAENAPVVGATVHVNGGTSVEAIDEGTGLYRVAPAPPPEGLTYVDTGFWTVDVEIGELFAAIGVELPPAANLSIAPTHDAGGDMVLDFTGQGFDSALVVVVDQNGSVTFTNEPDSIGDVFDLTQSDHDLETFTIPGADAFPDESFYAIGVAAMVHGENADIDNMNTAISSMLAGKMRFYPTSTVPIPIP